MVFIGKLSYVALVSEFIGTALFLTIATGTAVGSAAVSPATAVLQSALGFGFTITSLAYALGPRSGAHFNSAVTAGLVLVGDTGVLQGLGNMAAQVLGAVLGSSVVFGMFPHSQIGANSLALAAADSLAIPFLAEAIGTFCLVFVVMECCCNKTRRKIDGTTIEGAPLAIGFAVFIAHLLLIPYTSCSINPARAVGPALVSGTWPKEFWIFILGPFTGAAAAAGTHLLFERFARPAIAPAPAHV